MSLILGSAFLLFFFLSPPPPEYKYLRTETGEVTGIRIKNSRANRGEAPISVKLNDGTIIYMSVPTHRIITIGQSVNVDILETDEQRRLYRLAQSPIQP